MNPYKILYVSIIDQYKHQWHVVNAVINLRKEGYPICLDLVASYSPALRRLNSTIEKVDPLGQWYRIRMKFLSMNYIKDMQMQIWVYLHLVVKICQISF